MDQTPATPSKSNGMTHTQSNENSEARERLMGDLKSAINDAEQWLRSASNAGAEDLNEVKSKFQETLRTAKTDLLKMEDTVLAKGKMAVQATDVYVHDNPWKSVGLGAAIGVIVGMLISSRT
ncbi:DUF883 family protein [Massilia endophytica]|uniref:DUF883 family protein n=1 Tax=Massilia endophytica TaxID=2899220 RepID=UPI001E4C12A1|nr:DUF883 family protein [Massilia endophytica]UGQ47134.1 DUF883 domain-containing protein [Massilia endophytica]